MRLLVALALLVAPCLSAWEILTAVLLDLQPGDLPTRFHVRAGDQRILLQVAYLHTTSGGSVQAARDHAAYFGLASAEEGEAVTRQGMDFVRQALAEPFTVHTRRTAPADNPNARVGFVSPASGGDLAAQLVRNGLARPTAWQEDSPRGIPSAEMRAILQDLEAVAMLERVGGWANADPARLPRTRMQLRREETKTPTPVNVNTASEEELLRLPGMDPALAGRIVRGRPYRTPEDLLDVRGIGERLLASWRGLILTE